MPRFGSLAQLVERHVYTVDVIGSIPVGPTTKNPVIAVQGTGYGGVLWFRESEGIRARPTPEIV